MAEPKPQTAFTKDYIEKRIEARIASLKSKVEASEVTLEELLTTQAKKDKEWVSEMADALRSRTILYRALHEKLSTTTDPARTVVEKVNSIEDKSLSPRPPMSSPDRQKFAEVQRGVTDARQEIALIEHTLAYLKDSPVTEYSITALSKLGLLDAVRFSLELPKPPRGRRR